MRPSDSNRLGLLGFKVTGAGSQANWPTLDATWELGGSLDAFDAGWLVDHLTNATVERGGGSFESVTAAAALAHRVPGKWIGIAVLSNTFRHPSVLAKSAVVLDHATGGRFILGLGAGWHEGEHEALGIPLPPMRERFDRFEHSIRVLAALFSDTARAMPGVSLDGPGVRLAGATMEPPPVRSGGPPLWLGVGGPRGIALAGRFASGWPLPGNRPGDVAYFSAIRDAIRRALVEAGRDPDDFTFAGQVVTGEGQDAMRRAREDAIALIRAGANHVIVGIPGRLGPGGLEAATREVAEPVHQAGVA
jgi:alkanesulfonate monooxygenase SsuD/methylene tetrahydromethanopterin reductase-like flavin-dependent oxidoreductase (luciferase family)